MRKASITCLLFLLLMSEGCCPCRHLTSSETELQRDSIQIEYRESTVYVPDTVFVDIPVQTAERTTQDTLSHLENDYALSDARINTDGTLYHSLMTKPQTKAVPTKQQVIDRDSIVYRGRYRDRDKVQVIEKKLTWLQKAQIWGCRGLLLFVVMTYTIKLFRTHRR